MKEFVGFIIIGTTLILTVGAYLLPSIVAHNVQHRNKDAILILNLLLGWTGLGWVIALVWAFTNNRRGGVR